MKKTILITLVIAAVITAGYRSAIYFFEKPPLIPRALLFGSPQKAAARISPDGFLVAYLAPYQGVLNVWVRDRRAKTDHVLTHDQGRGITNYGWSPDGKSILFLQDQNGDENWHVYQIALAGGSAKDLTPFNGVQASILSSDKHFPEQVLFELNKEDRSRHDVYRFYFQTGRLELAARNTGQIAQWIVDPAMKVRGAIETRPEGGSDVWIRNDEQAAWKKIFSWDFEDSMTSSVLGFSGSGRELYLIDSRGTDTARLVEWDIAAGKGKVLLSDPQFDISGVIINPDDHGIEMVQIDRERSDWIPLRDGIRHDLESLRKVRAGDLSLVSRSDDDRYWVVRFENDVTPVYYYIYDRHTTKVEFLFAHQPALSKYKFSVIQPVIIETRDGLKLHGYKTLPRWGQAPFPMVLVVHGGPWTRDTWGYEPIAQWLADRGYVSLRVNFRGSVGFGKMFVNAGNKEWGRKMQNDLTDSVAWAVRQGLADPARIGIMGGSYGGYAALAAAVFTPNIFKCAIDLFGPSNLISLINSMPPYWSVEKANILRRIGDPVTETALLRERSPSFYTDRIRIPFLIAQGANDPRTHKEESDQIVAALHKKGLPCEYLVFPDEGHGFAKPENRLKFFRAAEAFLAAHLGGRYEP